MSKQKASLLERPFECLRRMADDTAYSRETVRNWYKARTLVQNRLQDIAFAPDSQEHLHVVLSGDSPQMLSVARQVALSAHYVNFDEAAEEARQNRTVVTVVSRRPDIKAELEREEYLCQLPKYCRFAGSDGHVDNPHSYVDIEIRIVKRMDDVARDEHAVKMEFSQEDVEAFFAEADADDSIFTIDTRKAVYASRMYDIGTAITNLPAEDIHCAERYKLALDIFQYKKLEDDLEPMFEGLDAATPLNVVKEKLSNVFCADCFESREKSLMKNQKDNAKKRHQYWVENNEALSKSEHARWVAEKLVMGYSPLNDEQRFEDERLSYSHVKRAQFRKAIKRQQQYPAHIDLCSYADLRRIQPDDLKYDSFLMLAIPRILDRVGGRKR